MEEKKEFQTITLSRGCIVDGKPQTAGSTHEVKITDAQLLIHSGKAVPKGDEREKDIIAAAKASEKAAVEAATAKAAKKG